MRGTRQQAEKALAVKVGNETQQSVGVEIEGASVRFDFENQKGLNRFIERFFQEKEVEEEVFLIVKL